MVMPLALVIKNRIWFLLPMAAALILTKSLRAFFFTYCLRLYYYLKGGLDRRKNCRFYRNDHNHCNCATYPVKYLSGAYPPLIFLVNALHYWKRHWRWSDHLVIGVGLGNFNLYLSRYAHNSYCRSGRNGDTGTGRFPGISLYLCECAKKLKRIDANRDYIKYGAPYFAAVFLIHNLIDFSFFLPEVSLVWWVILGLLL